MVAWQSSRIAAVLASAIVLCCAVVRAADLPSRTIPAGPRGLPPVEVTAMRDPVEKSYRQILRGVDLFEQQKSIAPHAVLRFKLLPRDRDTDMEGIALRIVGDTVAVAVSVAPDNTFTLPRIERALAEDALVVPNRRARSMTWRTDIRSPGLPPGTRRLGDLRLECRIGITSGLVSNTRPSLFGALAGLIAELGYCDQKVPHYLFFADRPLWSVTLVHGDRRHVLSVDELYAGSSRQPLSADDLQHCDCEVLIDRTYFAPLGDASWPNDTLLHFEYMDDKVDQRTQ